MVPKLAPGFAGIADRGTRFLLDPESCPRLPRRLAQEVIRHVQNARRKDAGLQMEDRIALYLGTDSAELAAAIKTHQAYIAAETLTSQWSDKPLGDGAFQAGENRKARADD